MEIPDGERDAKAIHETLHNRVTSGVDSESGSVVEVSVLEIADNEVSMLGGLLWKGVGRRN